MNLNLNLNLDKSAWNRVTFSDVARNINDYFDADRDGVLPYVAGPNINSGEHSIASYGRTDDDKFPPTFKRKFQAGDVLLHSRGIDKLAAVDRTGVTGEKLFVLRSLDEAFLLQEYLIWLLLSPIAQAHMKDNFTGSVNKFLNWKPLSAFQFSLPPLDEQKRIADLLWAIENHARSVRTSLKKQESVRSRWFEDALEQGVASSGWKRQLVTALITSGPTNGKSARSNDEKRGVPTLSLSAIRDGRVLGGSSVKYMDVAASDAAKFMIEDDDFLVVRGNGNKQLTGRGGVAHGGLPEGCVYPDLLIRLRFDPKVMLTAFAAEQWNAPIAHDELIQRAKSTSGIWKINGKDIRSHRLIVPPLSEQENLVERLDSFEAATEATRNEAAKLDALQTSLLAELFGGN